MKAREFDLEHPVIGARERFNRGTLIIFQSIAEGIDNSAEFAAKTKKLLDKINYLLHAENIYLSIEGDINKLLEIFLANLLDDTNNLDSQLAQWVVSYKIHEEQAGSANRKMANAQGPNITRCILQQNTRSSPDTVWGNEDDFRLVMQGHITDIGADTADIFDENKLVYILTPESIIGNHGGAEDADPVTILTDKVNTAIKQFNKTKKENVRICIPVSDQGHWRMLTLVLNNNRIVEAELIDSLNNPNLAKHTSCINAQKIVNNVNKDAAIKVKATATGKQKDGFRCMDYSTQACLRYLKDSDLKNDVGLITLRDTENPSELRKIVIGKIYENYFAKFKKNPAPIHVDEAKAEEYKSRNQMKSSNNHVHNAFDLDRFHQQYNDVITDGNKLADVIYQDKSIPNDKILDVVLRFSDRIQSQAQLAAVLKFIKLEYRLPVCHSLLALFDPMKDHEIILSMLVETERSTLIKFIFTENAKNFDQMINCLKLMNDDDKFDALMQKADLIDKEHHIISALNELPPANRAEFLEAFKYRIDNALMLAHILEGAFSKHERFAIAAGFNHILCKDEDYLSLVNVLSTEDYSTLLLNSGKQQLLHAFNPTKRSEFFYQCIGRLDSYLNLPFKLHKNRVLEMKTALENTSTDEEVRQIIEQQVDFLNEDNSQRNYCYNSEYEYLNHAPGKLSISVGYRSLLGDLQGLVNSANVNASCVPADSKTDHESALSMLKSYRDHREAGKNHTRSIFGYDKMKKINAVNAVIALLESIPDIHKDWDLNKSIRARIGDLIEHMDALNQGDLGEIFKSILQMTGNVTPASELSANKKLGK